MCLGVLVEVVEAFEELVFFVLAAAEGFLSDAVAVADFVADFFGFRGRFGTATLVTGFLETFGDLFDPWLLKEASSSLLW